MEHERLAELAEHELNPVQGSMRYQHLGFWDGLHSAPGEPTSFDPKVLSAYRERERQRGLPGVWRNGQYKNKGTRRDACYHIIEW